LILGVRYLGWRTTTLEGTGLAGFALGFVEILNYLFILLGVVLYWKVKQRRGPSTKPEGTLDVFIPVCGEPVEVVERTLQAALRIDYPHQTYLLNDGRIAGKANWADIEALAEKYGVQCFSRTDGARRKAGNLNHALKSTQGEFVAVIDADHIARLDLAHQLLGYFEDENVAYVSTAQFFETPPNDIFGNREAFFYTYIQPAKDASNSAISCGNGVIYRREALESIGGFSEWNIVEDLYSSYQLHANGWGSVYHPRPVTRGLAPVTGVEVLRQRLGWATDSLRMIIWDNPVFKKGLTFRQKLNYLHLGGFYLVMVTQLMFFLAPALVLLWDVPLVRSESAWTYVVYATPYFALQFLYVMLMGGPRGGLRSIQKGIYLAPTYLLATLRALTGINFASPVTEKARQKTVSWILLPQLLLFVLLLVSMVQAIVDPSWARAVAAVWAGWIASALAIPLFTVGIKRWFHKSFRLVARVSVAGSAAAAAVLAFVATGPPVELVPTSPPTEMVQAETDTRMQILISGITEHSEHEEGDADSQSEIPELRTAGLPPVRSDTADSPAAPSPTRAASTWRSSATAERPAPAGPAALQAQADGAPPTVQEAPDKPHAGSAGTPVTSPADGADTEAGGSL